MRADSVPMQHAFRAICSEYSFQEHLEASLKRISKIESLARTREIVLSRTNRPTLNSEGRKSDSRVTELKPNGSKTN